MKKRIIIPAIFLLASCSTQPEPLRFGQDACYTCKMTLVDKKFGAEIVTKKGKVYKFDDLNCMMGFYNSGYEPQDNMAQIVVVEFDKPEHLIDATTAFYIRSDEVRSPMGSQVAAFGEEEDMKSFNEKWNGDELSWEDLKTVLK